MGKQPKGLLKSYQVRQEDSNFAHYIRESGAVSGKTKERKAVNPVPAIQLVKLQPQAEG